MPSTSCRPWHRRARALAAAMLLAAAAAHANPPADAAPAPAAVATPAPPPNLPPLNALLRDARQRSNVPAEHAQAMASAVLPYAALAAAAYCTLDGDGRIDLANTNRIRSECKERPVPVVPHGWIWLESFPTDWRQSLDPSGATLGLSFASYARDDPDTGQVTLVFAFRGTEFNRARDWQANLRWFLPGADQYDLLAALSAQAVQRARQLAEQKLQRRVTDWRIVTTGHSLGGGLAQLMAYITPGAAAAIVFDPSPVTGYYDCIGHNAANCHVRVWRIYASGEVLHYARSLMRRLYDLSENITEIAFDGVRGSILARHDMVALYDRLLPFQQAPADAGWPRETLFAGATDCRCVVKRHDPGTQPVPEACLALATAETEPPHPLALQLAEVDPLWHDTVQRQLGRAAAWRQALAGRSAPGPALASSSR